MGFLDRLFGRDESSQQYGQQQYGQPQYGQPQYGQEPPYARQGSAGPAARSEDEIALERYRYLLRTAPPETIEQVHAEAFAKLTPEQRRMVYEELKNGPDQPAGEDAASLARSATRSEIRQPGFLEQRLGGNGGMAGGGRGGFGGGFGGPSFGSMLGASLLGTVAGYVVGSALVSAFLPPMDYGDAGGADAAGADESGGDAGGESGGDAGGDAGGDWGSGDGGFFGGGDFGGGDFGGGDFGGGDFGGGF